MTVHNYIVTSHKFKPASFSKLVDFFCSLHALDSLLIRCRTARL